MGAPLSGQICIYGGSLSENFRNVVYNSIGILLMLRFTFYEIFWHCSVLGDFSVR